MNFKIGSIIVVILSIFFVKMTIEAKFPKEGVANNSEGAIRKPTATELRNALVHKGN